MNTPSQRPIDSEQRPHRAESITENVMALGDVLRGTSDHEFRGTVLLTLYHRDAA